MRKFIPPFAAMLMLLVISPAMGQNASQGKTDDKPSAGEVATAQAGEQTPPADSMPASAPSQSTQPAETCPLSATIILPAKANWSGDVVTFQADMELANISDSPVRVCTACVNMRASGLGWYDAGIYPDEKKLAGASAEELSKWFVELLPGQKVPIPFKVLATPSGAGRMNISAVYSIPKDIAGRTGLWCGGVDAPPVIVRIRGEDIVVIYPATRPTTAAVGK